MNIHIIHRSIRLKDNTSLIEQIKKHENIIIIFIFTPEQIEKKTNKYFSNNSVQFMCESLNELSDKIKKKNGKLYFFYGDYIKVLKSIIKDVTVESISFNYEYTPYGKKRSQAINEFCKKNNIIVYELEDYALFKITENESCKKDKTPYLVYTPFKNNCINNLQVRNVDTFNLFKLSKNNKLEKNKYYIHEKEINNFYTKNEFINIHGGRKIFLKILKNIDKFKDYGKKRDFLIYNTTFLGAGLHFNVVSIREVYYTIKTLGIINNQLLNQLLWREFYMTITFHFPYILQGQITNKKNISYKKEFDNIKWSYNKNTFLKWANGETGFPIVDACMKQLNKTGFMHNRGRMITVSFATKDLHLDWRMTEQYFATKLVDYDAINNANGHQWVAGCGSDPQPWFRIFNPWTQQIKYDKNCEYIYKWLPELYDVPINDIHNWFNVYNKWLNNNIKYIKPIINHDEERLKTIKIYKKALY